MRLPLSAGSRRNFQPGAGFAIRNITQESAVAPHLIRTAVVAGLIVTLAACAQPPRATSSTATPDANGRMAPTPMTTAPAAPMR